MTTDPQNGSSDAWRAFAREETRPGGHAEEPARPDPAPQPEPAPEPPPAEPKAAGSQGRGAERVSVRAVGRRVRIVGDASVASASVSGPHTLRRSGSVLEITSEGQGTPLENFSLLKLPRSLDDLKNLGLGTELVVHVHPRLIVDAEVTASGLTSEGVPMLGRIRVSAGGATLKGVRQASDVLVQVGPALVEGPLAEGRSRVKCESGVLTVNLTEGANVTVRGAASMGRINWPGEGVGAVDEWVVGNGSGRLDVEIVMGVAFIKDASVDGPETAPRHAAAASSCTGCGASGQTGKFCAECGTPLAAACAGCGKALPAGAKFCPECGTPR